MAQPSKYDLLLKNKKAAGAAQRKKVQGYLHQGTIALVKPQAELLFELLLDRKMAKDILKQSSMDSLQSYL
jgi:lipoate-protein ligase A